MTLRDYLPLLVFLGLGVVIGLAMTGLSLLGPRRPSRTKSAPYESGILTTRPAKQRFSIDFYLTAMLFIVFDIELAFFYPLALVLRDVGAAAVIELALFVAVLGVAYAYIWRKGALEWH